MCLPTGVALRLNRASVVTGAAGDAVLGTHFGVNFPGELDPTRLPELGIAEIVRKFRKHVVCARGGMGIGLHKPVVSWNVAVAAARPHTFVVAAMRRVLEIRIVGLKCHGVAGSAKGVGRSVAVDHGAPDNGAGAENGADDQ